MKPIIGVVSRSKKDEEQKSIFYSNNQIIRSIIEFGGIPIIIPSTQNLDLEEKMPKDIDRLTIDNKNDLNQILSICNGIVVPGGIKWYEYDLYICKYAIDNDIPILGICAGMQALARVLNNNKELDITLKNDSTINHNAPGVQYVHSVKILKDSLLYKIINKEEIEVNSRHNYHIPNELDYLKSAYAPDGIIEAVEYKENRFTLGVQWHPESMISYDEEERKIIKAFIEASSR